MNTFEPKLEIRLVKSNARTEVIPGISTNRRRYVETRAIDLTPYLLENQPVRVTKSVREPAGAFGFVLADRMHSELKESLYALIEPMDILEIRMARSPADYTKAGQKLPVVMRGFVSDVTRSESISSGKPMRFVHVSGQDFGKILQILRIYYLDNSVVGDNIISEFKYFHKFADPKSAKIMSASDFVAGVVENVINPYMARITRLADGSSLGTTVINKLTPEVSIGGVVSPLGVSNFQDGSVGQLLASFLDVGPFNEMFVEERQDNVALVVRPLPYYGANGTLINKSGASIGRIAIDAQHVQDLQSSRTDQGVANYYWVTNDAWQLISNETMRSLSHQGAVAEYAPFTYVNCNVERYGFRRMQVESRMGPPGYKSSDAITKEDKALEDDKLLGWLVDRRRTLAAQNKDNVVFEHGSMRLRGNEQLRAGMYIDITRGSVKSSAYAVTITHEFIPFQSFKTVVQFERGTGWISRSIKSESPYLAELTVGGVK